MNLVNVLIFKKKKKTGFNNLKCHLSFTMLMILLADFVLLLAIY